MDTEDGELFIKSLAYYVRTHEKALANALQAGSESRRPSTSPETKHSTPNQAFSHPVSHASTGSSNLAGVLVAPFRHFGMQSIKSAKLTLTPNQLYYLLSRFEELGVSVGSMNVRMENISAETPSSNYVSFLSQVPKSSRRDSDHGSIHSVSSVRTAISSMSSMLATFNLTSEAKLEKRRLALLEDLRYLYSSFTKIPCICLINDHRARRISGYEEFPFDTAVPVLVFKNATIVEIKDVDFRCFFGWDKLSEQVRSLTIKRADLNDPADLLTNIVLDDMDKRRRRSSKTPPSPSLPISSQSPLYRYSPLVRSMSTKNSLDNDSHRTQETLSMTGMADQSSGFRNFGGQSSPPRRPSSQQTNTKGIQQTRRYSSESSASSVTMHNIKRNSSSNLLQIVALPSTKWRFLSHLCIADNGLSMLSTGCLAPVASTLRSLDLSSNVFTEIPGALSSLTALRTLNLSNCMVESVRSLAKFPLPAISVLNLRDNRISSLIGIEKLPSLERFDVRQNLINDPSEMSRLTGMPEFRDLYVADNPFVSKFPNYRISIFNIFRSRPGFSKEVTIDFYGPSYGERRHLVGKASEPANIPVVKRPFEDDELVTSPVKEDTLSPQLPAKDTATKKQRTPKRRIIDVSQHNISPGTRHDGVEGQLASRSNVLTANSATAVEESPRATSSQGDRHSISTDTSCITVVDTDSDDSAAVKTPTLENSNEIYKTKIEALKLGYGSAWLTELNERKAFAEKDSSALSPIENIISPRSSFNGAPTQARSLSTHDL